MYCLVAFYHEFAHELRAISPFWKFVVVKTVVFLSFWYVLASVGGGCASPLGLNRKQRRTD